MEMMFIVVVLAAAGLLVLACGPGWSVLAAQFHALFHTPPPGQISQPPGRPCEPASAGARQPRQGRHGTPHDTVHGPRRHTVVPHQARGR